MKYLAKVLSIQFNWHYCNLYKKYTLPQSKSSHLFDEGDIYVKESKTSYQWVQRWEYYLVLEFCKLFPIF